MTTKVKPATHRGVWLLAGFLSGLLLMSAIAGRKGLTSTFISSGGLPSDLIVHPSAAEPAPTSDSRPARRRDYEYKTTEYQSIYDATWTQGGYPAQSCWGCRFAGDLVSKVAFHSVLDAGTFHHIPRLHEEYSPVRCVSGHQPFSWAALHACLLARVPASRPTRLGAANLQTACTRSCTPSWRASNT